MLRYWASRKLQSESKPYKCVELAINFHIMFASSLCVLCGHEYYFSTIFDIYLYFGEYLSYLLYFNFCDIIEI